MGIGLIFPNTYDQGMAGRADSVPAASPLVATHLQIEPNLSRFLESGKISDATDFQLGRLFHFIGTAPVKRENTIYLFQSWRWARRVSFAIASQRMLAVCRPGPASL